VENHQRCEILSLQEVADGIDCALIGTGDSGFNKLAYGVQKVGHPCCRSSEACIPRALIFRTS